MLKKLCRENVSYKKGSHSHSGCVQFMSEILAYLIVLWQTSDDIFSFSARLLVQVGLVPRVWPLPLFLTRMTQKPSTKSRTGLRSTSLSYRTRLMSRHTVSGVFVCGGL